MMRKIKGNLLLLAILILCMGKTASAAVPADAKNGAGINIKFFN